MHAPKTYTEPEADQAYGENSIVSLTCGLLTVCESYLRELRRRDVVDGRNFICRKHLQNAGFGSTKNPENFVQHSQSQRFTLLEDSRGTKLQI